MTELLWQAWLLLAAAFFLGAVLACSLKRRFYYSARGSDIAASGIANAPAPGEPKIEVAHRAGIEDERFNRAISGQSAGSAPAAAPVVAAAAAAAATASAPAPAPAPKPAAAPAPVVAAAPAGLVGDDLTRIRRIDANIRKLLNDAGITKFAQLAALSGTAAGELADKIGLRGRIEQENWIAQAQILATGGETYYSRRKDRGEPVPTILATPRALEPVKPVAQVAASSLPLAFGSDGAADDLTRVRGIDKDIEAKLHQNGVHRFAHLAALTAPDIKALNGALGFYGRIERENWIGQAAILAAGGETYFSRRHDGAGVASASPAAAAPAKPTPAPVEIVAATPAPAAAPAPEAPAAPPVAEPVAIAIAAAPATAVDYTPREVTTAPSDDFTRISPQISHAAAADVAALRSVRSEALLGPDAVPAAQREIDDLKRIRGIGVLIEKKLNSLGILHYEQVANWTGADIERISSILDFKGRIEREAWIEQARILATGGQTEFSRRNET
jgi:predicted flap endonuclease-1-like 5' DNA nuclease